MFILKGLNCKYLHFIGNLFLLQSFSGDLSEVIYEVLSMETSGELDRSLLNLNLNLSSLIQSPSITSIDTLTPKEEYHSGQFI